MFTKIILTNDQELSLLETCAGWDRFLQIQTWNEAIEAAEAGWNAAESEMNGQGVALIDRDAVRDAYMTKRMEGVAVPGTPRPINTSVMVWFD